MSSHHFISSKRRFAFQIFVETFFDVSLQHVTSSSSSILISNDTHNKMTNVTPSLATNITISPISQPFELTKKGRGREKFADECPSSWHGSQDDEMISGRVLVTALLPPIRHYAFRFWLTQTFAQIAGNVLSPSSPVRRFDERVLVQPHTCTRRCNERVCKCVCHDYTRSSSVCNRSPFAGRSKERRGAHVGTWSQREFCTGWNKNRYAGFIIEIFGVDNIIVASHAHTCSNDISKLAIRDWEKWIFPPFFFIV